MLAKRVGPTGALFAFEPLPQSFATLKKNIALNGIYNATLLNVAVAAESGQAAMRATANLAMASMVWHCDDGSATEVRVETVAIDDLIESGKLPSPQFVKIDVEGAEGLVLQGMAHTIAQVRPIILLECSDIGRQTAWTLLRGLKYRCQSTGNGAWIDAFEDYRHVPRYFCGYPRRRDIAFKWITCAGMDPNYLPDAGKIVQTVTCSFRGRCFRAGEHHQRACGLSS